ncbi:hypothetical protein OSB04_009126 [Centaurea solstitialis]|uniref:Fe2OG dioxygenase domain-containing protein n=1 Tax=Centaurea solstitialis TaxID=347529 RepID=A0AA38TYM0_9ASTR|nr:hypothetical protein OSB04_009126 [Centaurea solstitialis]
MASATNEPHSYDRLQEVKQFDESKIGVKGLLDSGLTTIPKFFHQPPENLPGPKPKNRPRLTVPVIDLSGERSAVVEEIRRSASTLGFFQIVNHSIPTSLIDSAIGDMKKFFEESNEYKMKFYHREAGKGAAYSTNFDLYQSKAASWRDSLQVRMAPMEPAWDAVPEMCREALAEWDKAVVGLGEELMSILCEGLGVKSDKLKELSCLNARVSVSHYYPQCPQPDLTVGLTAHTDPGVLTVLVQNEVGGLLQVKCGDEDWADVEAVPGAIVINIGDLLQKKKTQNLTISHHPPPQPPLSPANRRRCTSAMASITTEQNYDHLKEVKQFDESKIGVKGLLDSGLTTIPRFFHQPPENLPGPKPKHRPRLTVPVIDLSGERSTVVEEIRRSASTLGFFQVVNHGISPSLIDSAVNGVKKFYEQSTDYKMKFYHREEGTKGTAYSTNFDLYQSRAASWRDTLQVRTAPVEPQWDAVPEMCRVALADWDKAVVGLGEELMSILSEGLGVKSDRLKELSCLDARKMVCHYYPRCPQPELTVGLTAHTDPGVLTVLVQNEVGGLLQVKCGEDWADIEAVPGAVVINIGDLLQIMSNDKYKSVMHRVLANPVEGARVSIGIFFSPSIQQNLYGPLPELISAEKPAAYREFTYEEYITRFFKKELNEKSLPNFYRINNTKA